MVIKGAVTQNKKTNSISIRFDFTPSTRKESNRIFGALQSAFERIAEQNGVKAKVIVKGD